MPDPDIPVIEIKDTDIERIEKEIIELPDEKKRRYMQDYNLSSYDAQVLTSDREISLYYESTLALVSKNIEILKAAKATANWLTGAVFSIANDNGLQITDENIPQDDIATLIIEFEEKVLTRNKAEELLRESIEGKKDLGDLISNAKKHAKDITGNIDEIVQEVIDSNPKAVDDYKAGKETSIGYLVGQVMQKTKGSADPNSTRSILIEKING